ncbi:MAG: PIG-L family deacetylase [Planctomycetota bacterium]|nr:PIG-L family deacetylase [Planctomycetota bacterium]
MKPYRGIVAIGRWLLALGSWLLALGLLSRSATAEDTAPPFERGLELIRNELRLARSGLRAMAIAAHPGDEDGPTLSYLRRALGVETHVCFATRGEGEENESGPEWGARLAVLRTREAEEACRILGAKPWYLNLPDFGPSRSADDTLKAWGRERALAQMVRVIRIVRPHIVFTDHAPDGKDHGHRIAAARLLLEAFDAAADEARFPEHLKTDRTKPWAVSKLCVRRTEADGATLSFDVSARDPLSGLTAPEVAACARRRYVSRGLSREAHLGAKEMRHFALLKSRLPKADSAKSMVAGLRPLALLMQRTEEAMQRLTAEAVADGSLGLSIRKAAPFLPEDDMPCSLPHLDRAQAEALGLRLAVRADDPLITYDESVNVTLRVSNAGPLTVHVDAWTLLPESAECEAAQALAGKALAPGEALEFTGTVKARVGAFPTFPPEDYVLSRLESRPLVQAVVVADAGALRLCAPVPVELAPPRVVSITPSPVLVFDDPDQGDDVVELTRFRMSVTSYRRVTEPLTLFGGIQPRDGAPVDQPAAFTFHRKGATQTAEFRFMAAVAQLNKGDIEVPTAVWTAERNFGGPAARLRRVPVRIPAPLNVGLVKTTTDATLDALKALESAGLGLTLAVLSPDDLRTADLNKLHTLVLDVRATHQRPDVRDMRPRLMQYMQDGGNVVCLCHTDADWNQPEPATPNARGGGEIAPFPIELSQERVTDGNAEVRLLKPQHPLLLAPCKIWARDFQGWVQERGACFPRKWAADYTPLLSCNDPGEKPLDGGLLVTDVGAGSFIYTSLAWHKQWRAGVPGAYRMLANLISYPRVKRGAK